MERNEHYHDRLAYLEGVVISHPRQGRFERTVVDFMNEELDVTRYLINDGSVSYELFDGAPETAFLVFNTNIPPYDDVHFRRALVAASLYGEYELTVANYSHAHSIIPPGIPGFDEDVVVRHYDPMLAAAEFRKSKYSDEEHILKFKTSASGFSREKSMPLENRGQML